MTEKILDDDWFVQAFWQGAGVRDRTIRSNPHNPAQFLKICEIPHNIERFAEKN